MDLQAFPSIDMSIPLRYCKPEITADAFKFYEFQIMAKSTFAGVARRQGLQEGEEWKVLANFNRTSLDDMLAEMDEIGVERCVMAAIKLWSRREHALAMDYKVEDIATLVKRSNGRVIGAAGYNPFRIQESLEEIDLAVKEYGFKYVWFHPISFGLPPNDKKCYPLYAKAVELGITVGYQSGHSAEPLPSEPGRPMYADEVVLDFPELTLILTHTGWPWVEEWCSMVWKHPNVYGCINAYFPSALDPSQVRFIDSSRGRNKVVCGSHGFGMTRFKKEFLELSIGDATKKAILKDNAIKALKLS
jgi:predicted TIM-barrel fold metal-dependent hydrolase